jgi:Icc-related predicted phosphoesterase
MIIDAVSDLHGFYPQLEGGDLLIIAGDLTKHDNEIEHEDFEYWLSCQKYRKMIFISGNHDNWHEFHGKFGYKVSEFDANIEYLCDSGTEFEYIVEDLEYSEYYSIELGYTYSDFVELVKKKKLKIWGSPWTLAFEGMNPHCKAFTVETERELAEKWALIPDDIDILVTHSPPYGTVDRCWDDQGKPQWVGSKSLQSKIYSSLPNLKLLVCGHIHEGYGEDPPGGIYNCQIINTSYVNEYYQPVNKPIRVIL